MAKLKVYRTQMGFVDAIVAASSRAGALKAWGVQQNLFAEKMAQVTDEPTAVKAAMARPGEVLQRPVGSKGAFAVHATAGEIDRPYARSTRAKTPSRPARERKPPSRALLDAAETALRVVDRDEECERKEIAKARRALDARDAELSERTERKRADANRGVEEARRDYQRRGGKL